MRHWSIWDTGTIPSQYMGSCGRRFPAYGRRIFWLFSGRSGPHWGVVLELLAFWRRVEPERRKKGCLRAGRREADWSEANFSTNTDYLRQWRLISELWPCQYCVGRSSGGFQVQTSFIHGERLTNSSCAKGTGGWHIHSGSNSSFNFKIHSW